VVLGRRQGPCRGGPVARKVSAEQEHGLGVGGHGFRRLEGSTGFKRLKRFKGFRRFRGFHGFRGLLGFHSGAHSPVGAGRCVGHAKTRRRED
jgi:hypothetical protein